MPSSKEYQKQYYLENKSNQMLRNKRFRNLLQDKIKKIKESSPCKDCGNFYQSCQMDFDHLENKKFNISENYFRVSWKKLSQEMDKCELVCANCHRLRTRNRKEK